MVSDSPLRRLLLGALLLALFSSLATAGNLYRYRNNDGVTVVDFHVPAEYAWRGYEVLSESGVVVEVVPRALTDGEKADASSSARLKREAELERVRLQEWDESLLLRYSSVDDIKDARDRALRDLKIRVSILKSNRRSLRQKVENTQARVAEVERTGGMVDSGDLDAIDALKQDIVATERQIEERQAQIDQVYGDYQADIDRFEQLQDIVQLRRNMERPKP